MIPALRYRVITDLHSRKPSVQAPNIMNFELHKYLLQSDKSNFDLTQ